jgi:hypothetical protein
MMYPEAESFKSARTPVSDDLPESPSGYMDSGFALAAASQQHLSSNGYRIRGRNDVNGRRKAGATCRKVQGEERKKANKRSANDVQKAGNALRSGLLDAKKGVNLSSLLRSQYTGRFLQVPWNE